MVYGLGLEQIFDGIKKNAERAKNDPEFAKRQLERAEADYYGRYIPSKWNVTQLVIETNSNETIETNNQKIHLRPEGTEVDF